MMLTQQFSVLSNDFSKQCFIQSMEDTKPKGAMMGRNGAIGGGMSAPRTRRRAADTVNKGTYIYTYMYDKWPYYLISTMN